MIIDVDPKALEDAPTDSPPAYEEGSNPLPPLQTKTAPIASSSSQPFVASTSSIHLGLGARSATGTVTTASAVPQSPVVSSGSWLGSFFTSSSSRDRDVKQTVLGLVRDLVHHGDSPDAIAILQSCAEACRARNLNLEHILQEPSIEGHTPLYWAILKHSPNTPPNQISLVDLLMSFPLGAPTLAEARAACLLTSDDALFQRLRRSRGCAGLNAAEEILLGSQPQDEIVVENAMGAHGAFKVVMHIVHFQKRMRVSRKISIEFIARGRIWVLTFQIAGSPERHQAKPGSWIVTVGLAEESPQTQLDSRLTVQPCYAGTTPPLSPLPDRTPSTTTTTTDSMDVDSKLPSVESALSWFTTARTRGKPEPIVLRLMSGLSPLGDRDRRDATWRHRAVSALSDVQGGAGLEFDGCPHLNLDGSLDATFEAELTHRPKDADCTVM